MKTDKQKGNCDASESSDDDIPLSSHKSNKKAKIEQLQKTDNEKNEISKENDFKNVDKVKRRPKVKSQYKNRKRIFCRSGNIDLQSDLYM